MAENNQPYFDYAWEDMIGLPAEPPVMREKCPLCRFLDSFSILV